MVVAIELTHAVRNKCVSVHVAQNTNNEEGKPSRYRQHVL
jgi:hypothetical protein